MHPKLNWLLIIIWLHYIPVWALACEQPNPECLQEHIDKQGERLQQHTSPLTDTAVQHWQFERQRHYLRSSKKPPVMPLLQTLEQEEKIIKLIRQGDIDSARILITRTSTPFHDLLAADTRQLIMQRLILNLEDQHAEQIKRELLETHWKSGKPPTEIIMNIARHEILGGDPRKGLVTLTNVQIDGFSNISTTAEHLNILQLGKTAENIFLDPTAAQKNCSKDSRIMLNSIQQFLSTPEKDLLNSFWNTPDIQQAWKAHLTLALLYKNSGSCDLLVSLHVNQVIWSAINYRPDTVQDFIGLIYLLRTIRRYLT